MPDRSFVVGPIDLGDVARYRDLVEPRYQHLLNRPADDPLAVGLGATRFGRPVGVVLAEISADGTVGIVRVLFVRPGYRNVGIGTELLTMLESQLVGRGCRRMRLTYPADGSKAVVVVSALLRRCGWEPACPVRPISNVDIAVWEAGKTLAPSA